MGSMEHANDDRLAELQFRFPYLTRPELKELFALADAKALEVAYAA